MKDWSNIVLITCVSIAAIVEALQQALAGATNITPHLPNFATSPRWNFVPLILLTTGGTVWLWTRVKRKAEPALESHTDATQSIGQQESGQQLAFSKYLWNIAEEDSRNMEQGVQFYWGAASTYPQLDAIEPYITLRVEFVNATVFELRVDHLEGRIQYRNSPLQQVPQIINLAAVSHGNHCQVDFRQWLLPETARTMLAELPVTLKTGNLALIFRYTDHTGTARSVRCGFPDEIFTVSK